MSQTKLEHCTVGNGHVTVAYVHNLDSRNIEYAVALCSPTDRFSRRKGRMIAEGRLQAYREGRDVLAERCLAGTLVTTSIEPNKRHVVNTVLNLLATQADEDRLRWLGTAYGCPAADTCIKD